MDSPSTIITKSRYIHQMKFQITVLSSLVLLLSESASAVTLSHPLPASTLSTVFVSSTASFAPSDGGSGYSTGEEPIGFKVLVDESDKDAKPIAFIPIYENDTTSEDLDILSKRDPEAAAWRWHKWVPNQAIYKREAVAEAAADAFAKYHQYFKNIGVFKRDAEADANAKASAWRWHKWVPNQAIY